MELGAAGLQEQPFRTHGKPLVFVNYSGQLAALDFLNSTYDDYRGLGLFLGPSLSGKTTILRQFVDDMDPDVSVAVVDGSGLSTTTLLEAVLGQYGYRLDYNSVNELINMLKVFLMQQTAAGRPPLLIVENTHAMNPNALRVLCELASIKVRQSSAMRMVFVSDRSIQSIIEAPAMECIADRLTGEFHLEPLERFEITDYLHSKLHAGGCDDPVLILPRAVCYEIHEASGGWPGIADRLALLALAKADQSPITLEHIEHPVIPESSGGFRVLPVVVDTNIVVELDDAEPLPDPQPRLYLSLGGKTTNEIELGKSRALIGRSEHNDLHIDSRFVSRHHAMFIRHGTVTILMDLNSTNGTYVNSRQISNHVMMHNDVVSIGNHSIKFEYPSATVSSPADAASLADTVIMKNLDDMRRILAQENTHQMLVDADDLVANGNGDNKSA